MTISPELLAAYRAKRAEQSESLSRQYWPHNVRDALRAARYSLELEAKRATLRLKLPRYSEDSATTKLPGGWSLTIEVKPDHDSTPYPVEDMSIEWHRRYSGPEPLIHGAPDGWMDRDGEAIYGSTYSGKPYKATPGACSGYGFAQYLEDYRARGMARQPAREEARRAAQRDADKFAKIMNDRYGGEGCCGYIVTLRDADGGELAEDSCWGFDDFDCCVEEAESVARGMIADAVAELEQKAPQTQQAARCLKARASELAREMKAGKGLSAPVACATLRDALRALRAQHSAALADWRTMRDALAAWKAAGAMR